MDDDLATAAVRRRLDHLTRLATELGISVKDLETAGSRDLEQRLREARQRWDYYRVGLPWGEPEPDRRRGLRDRRARPRRRATSRHR